MQRRDFMKQSALMGGMGMLLGAAAQGQAAPAGDASTSAETAKKREKTFWIFGLGGEDQAATAAAMKELGVDTVVSGMNPTQVETVREAGLRSWLCGGAFGLGALAEDTQYHAVDIKGNPQVWFGSGCPNHPELRARNLKSYEEMAALDGVEGIHVDGCRFASPASGLMPFLTCFCDRCREKAEGLGFDFDAITNDVQELHGLLTGQDWQQIPDLHWWGTPMGLLEWTTKRRGLLEWLHFRRICATEHFKDIRDIVKGAGKQMGVYIFTPSFAPLVGQHYQDLAPFMDVFSPMIYRNYRKRPGIACLNWEFAILPEELGIADAPAEAAVMKLLLQWAGLDHMAIMPKVATIRDGLPPSAVGQQTRLARDMIGPEHTLNPIIHIDDDRMAETVHSVWEASADDVSFFMYQEDWKQLITPALETV